MNDTYINYIDELLDLAERKDLLGLTSREFYEFAAEVRKALEKQIPIKPIAEDGMYNCGGCDAHVAKDYYCWKCGQELDWGEEV